MFQPYIEGHELILCKVDGYVCLISSSASPFLFLFPSHIDNPEKILTFECERQGWFFGIASFFNQAPFQ